MKRFLTSPILPVVVLIAAGGALYYIHERLPAQGSAPQTASAAESMNAIADAEAVNSAGLSQGAAAAAQSAAAAPLGATYQNSAIGFSFQYPSTLKAGAQTDDSGVTTVIVQDAQQHIGFQIYVTPYSGPDADITADEVNAQLPQMHVQSSQQVQVAGVDALAFLAQDPNFGDSRQVWFVHRGYLYQISSYSSQDPLLEKVLGTWKFSE